MSTTLTTAKAMTRNKLPTFSSSKLLLSWFGAAKTEKEESIMRKQHFHFMLWNVKMNLPTSEGHSCMGSSIVYYVAVLAPGAEWVCQAEPYRVFFHLTSAQRAPDGLLTGDVRVCVRRSWDIIPVRRSFTAALRQRAGSWGHLGGQQRP